MISFDFDNQCVGCGACVDACPNDCITLREDRDGFLMPQIVLSRCVDCHLCEKVCPYITSNTSVYKDRKCYSAYNEDEDIRFLGSSGSVFYSLAERIVSRRGIVYAAELCDDLQLRHTRATTIPEIIRQMKSKYIQSNVVGIYKSVLSDLAGGKEVLFVGTPCQCKALHNYIPAKLRNYLLIVDFVCHGVPSQSLFTKSLALFEQTNQCKVDNYSFREKTHDSLRNYRVDFTMYDGEKRSITGDPDDWPFYNGYFYHYIQRNSCFNCKMRTIDRDSDITIGDFWGIGSLIPGINDFSKGYSMLVTNSHYGQEALDSLHNCNLVEVQGGLDYCLENNSAYLKEDKKSIMRSAFFYALRYKGYSFCERHFLRKNLSFFDRIFRRLALLYDKAFSN